jgi:hypothetical protein
MNTAVYTKIAKSANYNDSTMSVGFRRYLCLPQRIRKAFDTAYVVRYHNTNIHSFAVDFFASMTETEYAQYVTTH